MKPETRLALLREEMKNGRIVEARLRAPFEHLDGLCDFGSKIIYIDPRAAIVSTLLHELIHRRWPEWSEERVYREEHRLITNMAASEIDRWYRDYQKEKRTRKTTKRVTDDED